MSLAKKIQLKEDEKIITVVQPHLLSYVWKYCFGLIFLFVFSFFMFRLFSYGWWGDAVYGLGMVVGFYIIFRVWFLTHQNVLVIASARVVDMHRLGWFDEIISSVSYLDIKDVVVRKKGIAQSLFNFGGIAIQTKSQQFVLEILNIGNPSKHQLSLSEISQQYKQNIKIANMQVIYNNFIKIIPDLTDGDLAEARALIDEQLGPDVV